jgi:hypothetical protein
MPELSFREAVERVMRQEGAAFAFCPYTDETTVRTHGEGAGANLFVIACRPAREPQPGGRPECCIYYVGGRYGTTSLARETYRLEEAPREAREASYFLLKEFDEAVLRNELGIIRRELLRRAES